MTRALHVRTPLIESAPMSERAGRRVLLKLESVQPSGSFKMRGIGHLCARAVAAGARRRLVASSGGNAGLAVACAAARLGVAAHIVVPSTTPPGARERLAHLGAVVEVHGDVWDEADTRARALVAASSGGETAYVPPFDHPDIWAGHATLVDELAEQVPACVGHAAPDAVVVSVGGGGLLCGVLQGMHRAGWSEVPVLAVETRGAASLAAAVAAGQPVSLERIDSVARTLGALRVADEALAWTRRHPVRAVQVTDEEAIEACCRLADDHHLLVEPACGAALSSLTSAAGRAALGDAETVVVVVCGGSLVTLAQLQAWSAAR